MRKLLLLISFLSIIVSCQDKELNKSDKDYNFNAVVLEEAEVVANYDSKKDFRNPSKELKKEDHINLERKFIKNGRVVFETDSISKTKILITKLVKDYKGYISSENTSKHSNRINQFLTLRIPAEQFDLFLKELSKGVKEYDEKSINISDVTEQFYDLTSRLKNKKQLEKRYLEILSKARSVKEILDVEREIGKLREDIESAEGRLKYLNSQVSLSTLHITFYKEIEDKPEKTNRFVEAFNDGVKAIKTFGLFLISIWPFAILTFIVYLVIRRRLKKIKS